MDLQHALLRARRRSEVDPASKPMLGYAATVALARDGSTYEPVPTAVVTESSQDRVDAAVKCGACSFRLLSR
jgi:hypothetical protein